MTDAIDIIHRDHVNFDRVLTVLDAEVEALHRGKAAGRKPDMELLFSIVYYMQVFPERMHHPKEERFLFPALAGAGPETRAVIERLQRQHAEGEERIAELQAAMKRVDEAYPEGVDELRAVAQAYIAYQREHMGVEERELLPKAREVLKDDDWPAINRAFARDSDPVFGENLETGFRALYDRITRAGRRAGT